MTTPPPNLKATPMLTREQCIEWAQNNWHLHDGMEEHQEFAAYFAAVVNYLRPARPGEQVGGERAQRVQSVLIERAVFDAYREGFMVGNEAHNYEYEQRVANAEGRACRYYDERRERLEKQFASPAPDGSAVEAGVVEKEKRDE